jgi:hypothetical protein
LRIPPVDVQTGRTVEQKQRFYQAVADGLHQRLSLRRKDVFINWWKSLRKIGRSEMVKPNIWPLNELPEHIGIQLKYHKHNSRLKVRAQLLYLSSL